MVFKSDDIAPKIKAIGLPFLLKNQWFSKLTNFIQKVRLKLAIFTKNQWYSKVTKLIQKVRL